jgi:hypothetical protein
MDQKSSSSSGPKSEREQRLYKALATALKKATPDQKHLALMFPEDVVRQLGDKLYHFATESFATFVKHSLVWVPIHLFFLSSFFLSFLLFLSSSP